MTDQQAAQTDTGAREALVSICDEIFERWDKDQRSGKLLTALAGRVQNYDPRVDRVLAALRAPTPATEAEKIKAMFARARTAENAPAAARAREWVLVPREPTEAMIHAGDGKDPGFGSLSPAIYRAMLDAAPPALPAGGEIAATQIVLGHGMVDIGEFVWGERRGVLLRPRQAHIPFGEPGELQNVEYWPQAGDVVLWIEGDGPGVLITELQAMLASPGGGSREEVADDPELDATDAAHPAWWRAHESTVAMLCSDIKKILDGKDRGHGVSREPWHSTRSRLLALRSSGPQAAEGERWKPTHRHVKRGSEYQFLDEADLQTDKPISDYEVVSVYRGQDGRLWARPSAEFNDGRFETLTPTDAQSGEEGQVRG